MSTLPEFVDRLRGDIEADLARAKVYGEEHLPMLANLAEQMSTNPLVAAALGIVHLEPGFLGTLASVITEADNKLGAAKQAQADADAAAAAALAAATPEVPHEAAGEQQVA